MDLDDFFPGDITRRVADIGTASHRTALMGAGIPDSNVSVRVMADQVLGHSVDTVIEFLKADEEKVEWRHTTKSVEGVWAAICVFWLARMFKWIARRFDWEWAVRAVHWAGSHWTSHTETFVRHVPKRICPHVPLTEAHAHGRGGQRPHLEWVAQGDDSDYSKLVIAERDVEYWRDAATSLAERHRIALSYLSSDQKSYVESVDPLRSV